jgi:hypothetical protein
MEQKEKEYLKRNEAAELLGGLKTQTLANWHWRGEGPPVTKLNARCIRYHRASLLAWAAAHTIQPDHVAD